MRRRNVTQIIEDRQPALQRNPHSLIPRHPQHQVVILDGGTTTRELARAFLTDPHATVVTPSPQLLSKTRHHHDARDSATTTREFARAFPADLHATIGAPSPTIAVELLVHPKIEGIVRKPSAEKNNAASASQMAPVRQALSS